MSNLISRIKTTYFFCQSRQSATPKFIFAKEERRSHRIYCWELDGKLDFGWKDRLMNLIHCFCTETLVDFNFLVRVSRSASVFHVVLIVKDISLCGWHKRKSGVGGHLGVVKKMYILCPMHSYIFIYDTYLHVYKYIYIYIF